MADSYPAALGARLMDGFFCGNVPQRFYRDYRVNVGGGIMEKNENGH